MIDEQSEQTNQKETTYNLYKIKIDKLSICHSSSWHESRVIVNVTQQTWHINHNENENVVLFLIFGL